MPRYIICAIALFIGVPAAAQQIEETDGEAAELALSNDTLELRYLAKMDSGDQSRLEGEVSW